jgi:diphthamide biosynthesis protein 4
MEQKTLYGILEVEPLFEMEDIKKSYQRLCLLYHPDKQSTSKKMSLEDIQHFQRIQHAWEVLRDPIGRQEYDKALQQMSELPLIHEEVDLDDMLYSITEHCFTYPCRCGDRYYLTEMELEQNYDIVCCETCSLAIRILYKTEDEF